MVTKAFSSSSKWTNLTKSLTYLYMPVQGLCVRAHVYTHIHIVSTTNMDILYSENYKQGQRTGTHNFQFTMTLMRAWTSYLRHTCFNTKHCTASTVQKKQISCNLTCFYSNVEESSRAKNKKHESSHQNGQKSLLHKACT